MKKISRYEKLGFKVVLEQSWLNLTLDLLLQQKTVAEIREILNEAISVTGKRSAQTTKFAISILSAWFDPENDLVAFAISWSPKLTLCHKLSGVLSTGHV